MAAATSFNPVQKDGRTDRFVEVAIKARPHNRHGRTTAMRTYTDTQVAPQSQAEKFADSAAGQERTLVRRAIMKNRDMNANRKSVLSTIINLWFANRSKGAMYPGAVKLASMSGLSLRTIKTYLAEFRSKGFITAVAYEKGGRNATRYTVSLRNILETLCPSKVLQVAGDLVRMALNKPAKPCKNCTRLNKEPVEATTEPKGWGDLSRFTKGFTRLLRGSARHSQDDYSFRRSGPPVITAPESFDWCPF
jgi:hypothetical protein